MFKLAHDVRVKVAAHGREESENGTEIYKKGTTVRYVGPSKVLGHTVVVIDNYYIRVQNASLTSLYKP